MNKQDGSDVAVVQAAIDEAERILNQTAECLLHVMRAIECVERAQKQIDLIRKRLEERARSLDR
jgi:hypothetical protein